MPLYSGHPPIYTGIWPYMLYLARIALYMGIYGYIQHCTVQWSPSMHCIHPLSIQWLPLTHCTPVWLYIRCIRPYCVIYGTIQYIYGPPCTVPVSTPIRHTGHPVYRGIPYMPVYGPYSRIYGYLANPLTQGCAHMTPVCTPYPLLYYLLYTPCITPSYTLYRYLHTHGTAYYIHTHPTPTYYMHSHLHAYCVHTL